MIPGETILSGGGRLADGSKDPHYSDFQIMRTPAGWYVGTVWTACKKKEEACEQCLEDYDFYPAEVWNKHLIQEPGTRETDYFDTEAEALAALEGFKKSGVMAEARSDEYAFAEKKQ